MIDNKKYMFINKRILLILELWEVNSFYIQTEKSAILV